MSSLHVLVVTGMSGAGRTSALRVLEDLGYYCVDNLPLPLASQLLEFLEAKDARLPNGEPVRQVGLGIDARTANSLEGAGPFVDALRTRGNAVEVLFLDCADTQLVRRYSESRRPHPLAPAGNVLDAITLERERLAALRQRAAHVLDTTQLSVHELRRRLVDLVGRASSQALSVRVVSFGFKYGLPVDADLVFDVRFLENPYFVPSLSALSGLDEPVRDFVLGAVEAQELLDDVASFLVRTIPRYRREGKAYLTIGIGCTGGRHRSVALVEALVARLSGGGVPNVRASHRDLGR